jgi:hypothetical protein
MKGEIAMPTFNKDKWSKEGPGGPAGRSNCYNYALDLPATTDKGKKLQPGEQSDYKLKRPFDCDDVTEGAKKDNLQLSDAKAVCGKGCWKVALFVSGATPTLGKDGDFHWYRQDDDGTWSHKMDGMDPSQVDNAGKKITDPEKADTGSYKFCKYFCVCPEDVKKKVTVAMAGPYSKEEFASRQPSVTGIFASGADNPCWLLGSEDLAVIRGRLENLPVTKRTVEPRLGENGYFVDLGDDILQVYDDVISNSGGVRFDDAHDLTGWLHEFARERRDTPVIDSAGADDPHSGSGARNGLESLRRKLAHECCTGHAHQPLVSALDRMERAVGKHDGPAVAITCEAFLRVVRQHMGTSISLGEAIALFETVTTRIKHPFCGPAEMYVDAVAFARDFYRIDTACNLSVPPTGGTAPDPAAVEASGAALLEQISQWELAAEPRADLEGAVRSMAQLAAAGAPSNDPEAAGLFGDFGSLCRALEERDLSATQANYLRGYVVWGGIASLCPLPGWWKLAQLALIIPIAIVVVLWGIKTSATHAKSVAAAKEIEEYIGDETPHSREKVREKAKAAAKDLTPDEKRELKKLLKEALSGSQSLDPKQKASLKEAIAALGDDD